MPTIHRLIHMYIFMCVINVYIHIVSVCVYIYMRMLISRYRCINVDTYLQD